MKSRFFLLIVADDQSYPHAGAYGCPWVKTPGFDRIADPECMRNLSLDPASKKRMKALRRRMDYYERWFSGKINKKKEKTFNLDDYEKE